MFSAAKHPYLVPFDGEFDPAIAPTAPGEHASKKKALKEELATLNEELAELQRILYADNRYAVLLIFQAMDAAGKDSTIRAVMSGVNPAGCQVYSFKQPSAEELDHDFLWRSSLRLPERGRIGVFNRSYYEETLVVRVHPEYLAGQRLPYPIGADFWEQRFESIREHEHHLARNGTIVLKFWLNVSREEQRQRFIDRLDEPEKNWKFSPGDVAERQHWDVYMHAYGEALAATSRPWAPWYAIPADSKPYMRMQVARIIVDALKSLDIRYPEVGKTEKATFEQMRTMLEKE